ncbi:hypothetical protein COCMIDRAFT_36950 [Bipolaris oryzae ATCC 44560]|uniref:Uncharacterized protein n=1 Tax=Bipolaris oryzae ATCC 44560 TaxID=930090 RepID=W6Z661_COCMI|nr:uncharacterized protein COCMIDRAFT_36950 [Bipolaris oryzae ATCC 44560]EUC45273.1 hypothetical protein COCMIDRAFT_36950 [Bipolaris oryzae ATCC 44560]
MASLSVSQVSALIAAGTTARKSTSVYTAACKSLTTWKVQLLLPLAIPLILIAFINKRHDQVQQTAVTWSALSRTLHSTYWPTILNSDSSASANVNPAVVAAVYLGIFTTVLVAVTAVITPLGLYDAMVSSKPQRLPFSYASDLSPFGYGSLPRNDMGFSRICGSPQGSMSCPRSNFSVTRDGSIDNNGTLTWNWTDGYYYTNISLETQNLWESGLVTMQKSVSSIFDIQWRSYEIRQQNLSSMFAYYNDTSSSTEKYYDNGSPYLVGGYRTIQGLLPSNGFRIVEGLVVDLERGGIGFRNHTIPSQPSHEVIWTEDILFVVPETSCVDNNLTIDYDLKEDDTSHTLGSGGILRLTDRGGFANLNSTVNLEGIQTMNSSQDRIYLHARALYAAGFSNALTMIYMNLTNEQHGLGEFRMYEQAPVGISYILEDESKTSTYSGDGGKVANSIPKPGRIALHRLGQHLDLPSSANIASNHTFLINHNQIYTNPHNVTTDLFKYFGLLDLHVINVTEKSYPNTSSMPIWGVENSGMTYGNITPFWVVELTMNIPGASFYSTIMRYIYGDLLGGSSISPAETHDYSGYGQFALYQRWLELGRTATLSADIINLIWTDIAANAVVGTRSWLSKSPGSDTSGSRDQSSPREVPNVTLLQRKTKYHIAYAVPAMLLLLLALVISVATAILLLLQRTGLNRMRWFLNQTSLGRNFTALLYPEVSSQQSSQKIWAKNDAHRVITVDLDKPYADNQADSQTSSQSKGDVAVSQRLMSENGTEHPEQQ